MSEFELSRSQQCAIGWQMPDTPETCIAIHALYSGRGRAFGIVGPDHTNLIVDADVTTGELLAFGDDPAALARILATIPTWKCIEVAPQLSDELAHAIRSTLGVQTVPSKDLYFTLTGPIVPVAEPRVRLLTHADAGLYAQFAKSFGDDIRAARRSAFEGPLAAAIVGDRVVAAVEGNVGTKRFANFMAKTLPDSRGLGFATAAGAMCAAAVCKLGRVPLWSCHESNLASQRVAKKIGFTPVSQCVYLFPEKSSD